MPNIVSDVDLTSRDVSGLSSSDAVASFLTRLGYPTDRRKPLTAEAVGLSAETAKSVKEIEQLAADDDGFLRVVFVRLKSLTARARYDLTRAFGKATNEHLLVLTDDFRKIEFLLIDRRVRESAAADGLPVRQAVPLTIAVDRRHPAPYQVRVLRRLTWLDGYDGLDQYDKLRHTFQNAAFASEFFSNRALFSDYFLCHRLRDDAVWRENPASAFRAATEIAENARRSCREKSFDVHAAFYEPLLKKLGFAPKRQAREGAAEPKPDYLLADGSGTLAAVFAYPWDRRLDGPDPQDRERPDESPAAAVVAALDRGDADWVVATNGVAWRLYSRAAHSRSTNFYEVELPAAIEAAAGTDPNEAFRYWWLFFRSQAFAKDADGGRWLDRVAEGSRDYAKRLGDRLKVRIFEAIFPHLAEGFLNDRRKRLELRTKPSAEELTDVYEATLTLLYRLLFLLYAEARDLLPVREPDYAEISLHQLKKEVSDKGGRAPSQRDEKLSAAYSGERTELYDRLAALFKVMDKGDADRNVPTYNGGLFRHDTKEADLADKGADVQDEVSLREARIARFLKTHKVPDRPLALALDRLARDEDDKTFELVFIDYKSLAVRHLGSIYEGLLEFRLAIAKEDLTTKKEKGKERYIPLGETSGQRRRTGEVVVAKGKPYLSNDKAERKASGSYYTPDPIVTYIVEHTVGPVLGEKLEALRPQFRDYRKAFDRNLGNAKRAFRRQSDGSELPEREWAARQAYEDHGRKLVETLFELRVLDPAMGSGHFLVEVVDFVTDRLLAFLSAFPVNPVAHLLGRTRREIVAALEAQGVDVDPDRLTDVHLLKRHVLKRCVYGVDLNPMAVELAKVSLWLDAFTLGAPLSFLQHHLRCGNSLVGATFKDLRAAAAGSLFRIDIEPLNRAIHAAVLVARTTDSTSDEVKQSESAYHSVRRNLSGYRIVFDLLTARHFGFPQAADLFRFGNIEIADAERLRASLKKDSERRLLEEVAALARRDYRFFHWELEFPEVFFDEAGVTRQHLKHKNDIEAGSAGFDAVVGNPPYVRVELLAPPHKRYLKEKFRAIVDRCDIYTAFVELPRRLLRRERQSGLIVSNQFLNTDYGAALRELLKDTMALTRLVDVSPLQVFEGALTYPAVVLCSSSPRSSISVTAMEKFAASSGGLDNDLATFAAHVNEGETIDASHFYSFDVWSASRAIWGGAKGLETARVHTLKLICNISSSMKSGRDEILVGKIVAEYAKSYDVALHGEPEPLRVVRSLWRKVVRPKDLAESGEISAASRVVFWPYEVRQGDDFQLLQERDIADRCGATHAYLVKHKRELKDRRDSGKTWTEHGRKWYSLARVGKPSDYTPPKLLSPGEFTRPRFLLDTSDSLFPCARIIGISQAKVDVDALRAYLHSKHAAQWFRSNLPAKGGGFRGMSVGDLGSLPVPSVGDAVWQQIGGATSAAEVDSIIGEWLHGFAHH